MSVFRRRQSPVILAAMRDGCDGMTSRAIAAHLGLAEDVVQVAMQDLRQLGFVRRAKSVMAYDEAWPPVKGPHAARVLLAIRRGPRTVTELADDMARLDPERDNLPIVSHKVRKLRAAGHVAPPGAWLMTTLRAPRTP